MCCRRTLTLCSGSRPLPLPAGVLPSQHKQRSGAVDHDFAACAPAVEAQRLVPEPLAVTRVTTNFEREVLVIALAQSSTAETTLHRWRAFSVLAVSYFMTIIDLTIVNVALPTIGRKLHFSETN